MATRVPHSFDSNSNFTHDISGLPLAVDHSMGPTTYGTLSSIEIGSSASAAEQFSHCFKKLCSLRPTKNPSVKTELNLLFDQLISENYRGYLANTNIKLEDVCALLVQASRLVPLNQEHLVIKLCQLIHQLLNQLQVIVDEQTLDTLVTYCTKALHTCSSWTHPEVLLAVASLVYGNGPRCQQHLPALLGEDGVLLRYTDPAQSDVELRRCSVHCMASLCLGVAGQPCLEEPYRRVCFRTFLRTLQSPKPAGVEDIVFCTLLQSALKGMQCFLNCGKWKAGPGEELGSLLAVLKKFMFFGLPGVTFEMPQVLFPAPLPQYEGLSSAKPETPPNTSTPHKLPGPNKKRKSRGRGKKGGMEGKRDGAGEEGEEDEVPAKTGGGERKGELLIGPSQNSVTPGLVLSVGAPQFCPSWRKESSDSEFSDPDGGMQSKLRLYQARVRLAALNCFLSVVKCVEKKMLHGYWSSFIPDGPTPGAPPPLSLLTIALKDPSPKVRAGSLQVLSALLEGSRQFLSVAEDTGTPRQAFTPFSATLAASLRELHRCLLLALLAESSSQTLTQVIKCLAHLVSNVPYNRLKPGLLSPLWRQIRPYVHHRDVNVRVSSLTLLGALVSSQAPLPEVQLLLEQPWPQMAPGPPGGAPPQEQALSWRQPAKRESPQSPVRPQGPRQGPLWLLQLCVALVTQPRDDSHSHSDSDGAATTASASLEPSPVRLEALQVLAHLVKGYFRLTEGSLLELAQLSARCLQEHDPSVQLHGAKLLEELGTGIVQQYRADGTAGPSASRVPVSQVVEFWKEVLGGPLIAALQNEQHPTLQTSACDTLSTILPQAFSQLPDKTQVLCITMLLGLTYSENSLVKAAAVRALGVYILFPTLREDVMFVADTANAILTALDDRSPNVRAKAAWSLGNLTDTLIVNMDSVGQEFQEEFSDMLLLKMLKCATQATGDKDRVKSNAVRALGNLLHFLRPEHLSRSGFEQPLQEAFCALIHTVRGEATMKVRWNACYALGNAFRNPSLPLGTASWSVEAFSTLSHVVTSCKNFKVRIKCAAALSVPTCRRHYGDASQFAEVWHALAQALEHSEDTEDFLEYRYCASLRAQLCHALLHLLFLCQPEDLATLAPSLAGQSGPALRGFLARYLSEGEGAAVVGEENNPGEEGGACVAPQDRLRVLNDTLTRLRGLEPDPQTHSRKHADIVVGFLEDLLKSCEETKETSFSCASLTA